MPAGWTPAGGAGGPVHPGGAEGLPPRTRAARGQQEEGEVDHHQHHHHHHFPHDKDDVPRKLLN